MDRPLRLELGCGNSPTPGYVHHDRIGHAPHVDLAWDLRSCPWNFGLVRGDDSQWPRRIVTPGPLAIAWDRLEAVDAFLDEILALDVFEHVSVHIPPWLDECWRLLKPGGLLDMRLPAWDNHLSYRDPTHLRVFHEESFCYFDPDHGLHKDFGSIYFAEGARWWAVEGVTRENGDFRYRIRKRGKT